MIHPETLREHTFLNLFNKDSVILDLGAHKGEFSSQFAEKHPFARIIMVEPNPYLFKVLQRRFGSDSRFILVNAAVSGVSKDHVNFFLSKNPEASSLYKAHAKKFGFKKKNEITVKQYSFQDLCSEYGINKISLLKIDIEGGEWELFKSFSHKDFEKIDQITMEFHDFVDVKKKKHSERIVMKLKKRGYMIIAKKGEFMHGTQFMDTLFYKDGLFIQLNLLLWDAYIFARKKAKSVRDHLLKKNK